MCGLFLALFANFDHIARLDGEGRDVHLPAIDIHVTVADELAALRSAGGKTHAVDNVIQAPLEHRKHESRP